MSITYYSTRSLLADMAIRMAGLDSGANLLRRQDCTVPSFEVHLPTEIAENLGLLSCKFA